MAEQPKIKIVKIFLLLMKTPERSRTSRDPQLYSPFAPKSFCLLQIERHTQINYVMSRDVMTSYRDVMSYCRVT